MTRAPGPRERAAVYALLLASAVVKGVYVFAFTDYTAYVFSDMGHYFGRAQALLGGAPAVDFDFAVFPPASAFFLFAAWKALGLGSASPLLLPTALALNIAASTASGYLFWRLLGGFDLSARARGLCTAVFALFYPLVYLNAFVLSETPAQLFFLAALFAVVRALANPTGAGRWLLLAGALWMLACLFRPAYLPCALAAGLAVLAVDGPVIHRLRLLLATALGAASVLVLFAVFAQQLGGEWRWALTGNNGGMNFFMQQCHYHGAEAGPPGNHWLFIPPPTAGYPELGIYQSPVPFTDQGFYFAAGWNCLMQQPGALPRLLLLGPTMLYGGFLPSMNSATGFAVLMPLSRHALVLLLVLVPVGLAGLHHRRTRPLQWLVTGCIALMLLTFVLFNADHRHLYSLLPLLLIAAAHAPSALQRRGRGGQRRYALAAAAVLALAYAALVQPGDWHPHRARDLHTSARVLRAETPDGSPWTTLTALRFGATLRIDLQGLQHAPALSLSLDDNDHYELRVLRNDQTRFVQPIAARLPGRPGLVRHHLQLPPAVAQQGYDALQLRAVSGDGRYAVAWLQLHPAPVATH